MYTVDLQYAIFATGFEDAIILLYNNRIFK